MSEMALTASRKARLQVMVESREPGAQAAMDLHENPTKFLSTVQIGITSIGVLNGIVGEAAFSGPLAHWLVHGPWASRTGPHRSAPPAWWWC
jgi:putative hemolysin